MAKQLNLMSSGQVIPIALHTEMQQSYLEYAMSVIVGRALPDVRDGLKPVHRRIIYAMHELGLTPDRPFRKCARVVGDVLGKYHPHGDQAVYDALVRMVQDFSSRYPLLAGHGNFGSVDDDPPAAMRYTETRLAGIAQEALLAEIGEATVDFTDNFDSSQQEPVVLPAQLPLLLLNGSSGIAVGMATNIPPHNLGELVDGLVALIDRPNLSDRELLDIIPGPDFPTGGEIVYTNGIRDAYLTGRGSISLRGVVQMEEFQPARGRHRRTAIVVTELPYQVNKAAWIEKIADLVNTSKLEGIADLRDESDRDGMRVVIELKRDANSDKVLQELYRQTPLQQNFGAILLALLDGQPRQLSLKQLLQEFLGFREQTLTRRFNHELEQANQRSHILEGLLKGLADLDQLIAILRQAPDGTTAKVQLQEQLDLSDRQADAILAMPLRRLTGLEQQNLHEEFATLSQRRAELERLLDDRRELLKALKKDLRAIKRQFGDARRTRIVGDVPPWPTAPPPPPQLSVSAPVISSSPPELPLTAQTKDLDPVAVENSAPTASSESTVQLEIATGSAIADPVLLTMSPVEPEPTILELTQHGFLHRYPMADTEDSSAETGMVQSDPPTEPETESEEDAAQQVWLTRTNHRLLLLTQSGKAYTQPIYAVPPIQQTPQRRGMQLQDLLPPSARADAIAQVIEIPQTEADRDSSQPPQPQSPQTLLLLTEKGRMKRVEAQEFADCGSRGLMTFKFKEPDQLLSAQWMNVGQEVMLANQTGRLIRFTLTEADMPISNRNQPGLPAMRLGAQEVLVGGVVLNSVTEIVLISQFGYYQRIPVTSVRRSLRGDLGTPMFRFAQRGDRVIALLPVLPSAYLDFQLSQPDQPWVRAPIDSLLPTQPGDVSCAISTGGEMLVNLDAQVQLLKAVVTSA
jgi:DNA gyrase subunit A